MVAKTDKQENLREWVEKNRGDWSIRKLARRAELSHVTITQFLNRQRNAGLEFCLGMARAFGVSPVIVLAEAGIIPPLDDEETTFRELWHHVRRLGYKDRVRLIQIAREWSKEDPPEPSQQEEPPE